MKKKEENIETKKPDLNTLIEDNFLMKRIKMQRK